MSSPTVAQSQTVVHLPDGSNITVVHLAGGVEQPLKVLCLHANGFHIKCLGPLARCLKQHALCIGVELRGQGATQAPNPAEQLVTAYIQDVAAVVQKLGLQGCFCFGHSGGGQVALALEAQQPGTFAAIYAYEPVLTSVPPEKCNTPEASRAYTALSNAALRRKTTFGSKQDVERRYRTRPPFASFHVDAWQAYLDNNFTENKDGSCTLTCHPANEARWFHDAGQYCNSQVWDQVPQIQCPVRLAVGSPSGNMDFLVTGAAAQVNRFPDAKLKRFEHQGHLGPLEDPAAVAADASAFFLACHTKQRSSKAKL